FSSYRPSASVHSGFKLDFAFYSGKYTSADRGFYLKRYEVRNIADKLRKQGLISPKEREFDKHPQQSVRFQSLRSLSDRARFSRLTGFSDPKTSNSMQDSQ
ncbi:hypothetical protein COOONC_14187, partial [Cooperia oncophora]